MATMTVEQQGQAARVDALFERLAELQGQRNAIDAEIVDVVRGLADGDLWGITGARSLEGCVAWKTGSSRSHAEALVAVARRADELPRCVDGLRSGALSLDQVAVIAEPPCSRTSTRSWPSTSGTARTRRRTRRRHRSRRWPTPSCGWSSTDGTPTWLPARTGIARPSSSTSTSSPSWRRCASARR